MQKLHTIGNIILTKCEDPTKQLRELFLHICSSDIATEFVPTGLKKSKQEF